MSLTRQVCNPKWWLNNKIESQLKSQKSHENTDGWLRINHLSVCSCTIVPLILSLLWVIVVILINQGHPKGTAEQLNFFF